MPDDEYDQQVMALLQRIALAMEAIAHNTQGQEMPLPPPKT
jgi:hypothetical protein